jgi:Ca2+-binding RTX toxin-like protein
VLAFAAGLLLLGLPGAAAARGCDLRGTAAADRLTGGWPGEVLCGLRGDDALSGRTGDDRVDGGPGNDRLSGGSGNDRLDGGDGNDEVGKPSDFGAERGDDTMYGGPGNDRIESGQGDDWVDAGPGDDVVRMGFGDDRLARGGDGVDRLFGENGNDGSRSGEGGLLGGKGQDRVDGGDGNDVVVANSGADELSGGDGDDLIWALDFERNSTTLMDPAGGGVPGDNTIDCGAGNDMAVIDLADDRNRPIGCEYVIVVRSADSYCSPLARWLASGPLKTSLLSSGRYPPNANRVLQTTSPFAEKPARPVDENSMRSCADYGARFLVDPTDDPRPNVRGTEEPDVLTALLNAVGLRLEGAIEDAVASVFNAGEGDDTVNGSEGSDTVLAGPGDDTVYGLGGDDGSLEGEDGNDRLFGGDGNDLVFGRAGDDMLYGGPGDDYLEGGRGDDGLSGGDGHDELYGGYGADRLKAGPGNDALYAYDGTRDVVDCGPGIDEAEADRYDELHGCERVLRPATRKKQRKKSKRRG